MSVLTVLATAALCALVSATPAQRVVSTAPSITEMLFALGAGDRVVGVTTYCEHPPDARQKPKIGSYTSPNLEAILRQRPDLVAIVEGRTDLRAKLKPFNIPTVVLAPETLDGIEQSIMTLAARLQLEDRGRALVARIRRDLATVASSVGAAPRRRVLFIVGRTPGALADLFAVGRGGYLDEIIGLAGGSNVFADAATAYTKVPLEEVLARDPDVIVDMSHGNTTSGEQAAAIKAMWGRLPALRAVRGGEVHVIAKDVFVTPGPRVTEAVAELARIIHGRSAR